jgi:O-methyltransferase involved in polyketide biosynthesis
VFADAHRWPDFEHCLEAITALVMLEGVSPYIKAASFDQFLRFLVVKLHPESIVAYDYKIQGHDDQAGNLFRLPVTKHDVIAYHERLGTGCNI